jgi:hypothetical protein
MATPRITCVGRSAALSCKDMLPAFSCARLAARLSTDPPHARCVHIWPPLTHGIHGFAYTGEYPIPTIEAPLQRSPTYQGKVSEKSNGNYVDNINGKDCDTLQYQARRALWRFAHGWPGGVD